MLLSDIVNSIIVSTGQHLSGELKTLRLDMKKFWSMAEKELFLYQQHWPVALRFNIETTGNAGPQYDFTADYHNLGADLTAAPPTLGPPPEWISRAIPVGQNQMIANWAAWQRTSQFPGQLGKLITPRTMIPRYRKPILYTTEPGRFDVEAMYHYYPKLIQSEGSNVELKDVDIIGMDASNSKIYIDMLAGKFLTIVGRSRRAFTHNELPITTDADALVKEGNELYEKAQKAMIDTAPFTKSYRF